MNGGEVSVTNLSTLSSSVWQKLGTSLEAQRDASSVLENLTKVPAKLTDPDHPRPSFWRGDSSVLIYQHRPAPPGHRPPPPGLPEPGAGQGEADTEARAEERGGCLIRRGTAKCLTSGSDLPQLRL